MCLRDKKGNNNVFIAVIILIIILIGVIIYYVMVNKDINSEYPTTNQQNVVQKTAIKISKKGNKTLQVTPEEAGETGGTPEKPVMTCKDDNCALDFGDVMITDIPRPVIHQDKIKDVANVAAGNEPYAPERNEMVNESVLINEETTTGRYEQNTYNQNLSSVPRTPDEIRAYLIRMKKLMGSFGALSNQLNMIVVSKVATPEQAAQARSDWLYLARQIDALAPPDRLAESHKKLVQAMQTSMGFLKTLEGLKPEQKSQIIASFTPIVKDLTLAVRTYHSDVLVVIKEKQLDPSLDPFGK